MNARTKLFLQNNPYRVSDELFLAAVRENAQFHLQNCPRYSEIAAMTGFDINSLKSIEDIAKIPVLPTLLFKRQALFSMTKEKLALTATSSGTKGQKSELAFDKGSLALGVLMMLKFFSYHKVTSVLPANYIVLGYEPGPNAQMGAAKTAYGTTKFAPALHREYALKSAGTGFEININGIMQALLKYEKQSFPVRFVGFPSYFYFLLKALDENKIYLKLNKRSLILLGGGWKQFSGQETPREELLALMEKTLGLKGSSMREFFSAVEHPLPYCKCKNGHFHVPAYSRAVIRDINTLNPVPFGQTGLLSFISPLVKSMPLLSVMTDDLAVLTEGNTCGCGIGTPYFTLLGRAGAGEIKTCAASASELLGGAAK